jgi:hypothetical protein
MNPRKARTSGATCSWFGCNKLIAAKSAQATSVGASAVYHTCIDHLKQINDIRQMQPRRWLCTHCATTFPDGMRHIPNSHGCVEVPDER